jgi:hypothetical protein
MPKGAIYVGRGTKWGNCFIPFFGNDQGWCVAAAQSPLETVGRLGSLRVVVSGLGSEEDATWEAVRLFEAEIPPELREQARLELRSKTLACWCEVGAACHGDTWLRIANSESEVSE